jgi:hypothetical protein
MTPVPMRWPASPREHWTRPEALTVLTGTPVNCLILPDDSGPQGWRPLIERAEAMGAMVVSEGRVQKDGILVLDKCVWPSVRSPGRNGGSTAGPTGSRRGAV